MAHVTVEAVQGWLQATKLKVDEVDPALDEAATNSVFGQLASTYVTTSWIDEASTPSLVQTILSMCVASYMYRRAYAEVADHDQGYATWLEDEADALTALIQSGSIVIPGATQVSADITDPTSWPNDTTGSSQQYDAAGNMVGADAFSEDIKFRIGTRF